MPGNLPAVEIPQVDAFELLVTLELHRDLDALPAGLESEALDALAGHVGHEVEVPLAEKTPPCTR